MSFLIPCPSLLAGPEEHLPAALHPGDRSPAREVPRGWFCGPGRCVRPGLPSPGRGAPGGRGPLPLILAASAAAAQGPGAGLAADSVRTEQDRPPRHAAR